MERTIPSKSLVQFESLGKFVQDVWLVSFVLIFIDSEKSMNIPFVWIGILMTIALAVHLLFFKTGYQIAVSVIISVLVGIIALFFGVPLWLIAFILVFSVWRIQERYAKIQENPTHDGAFLSLLVVFFAGSYFLATVFNQRDALHASVLLSLIGLMLFLFNRLCIQWLRSRQSNQVPFSKVFGLFISIIGVAAIAFGLIAGFGKQARESFTILFEDVFLYILYPFGLLIQWLQQEFSRFVRPPEYREETPVGELQFEENQPNESNWSMSSFEISCLPILIILCLVVIVFIVWRFSKLKVEPIELLIDQASMERSASQTTMVEQKSEEIWQYSMETNVVREAYRDFEKSARESDFHRQPNETLREWFKREGWLVSERFYEVYDVVRYSGAVMNAQDGQWFINELENLFEKYFN